MVKNWLQAFRLRTLPLAIGAITMGAFVANINNRLQWDIYFLTLLTATLLQILSNLANDYGDFKKGTDNEQRLGPTRSLQSGAISEKAMLRAVILFSVLSLLSGIVLLWLGLKDFSDWKTLAMLGVGIAAIAAAIKYTVGKAAYGYSGWGDVFVFIFFGLVSVGGTYFLMASSLHWQLLLPATCFGCLSACVLNINNIRDIKNDKENNKITLAVKLGRDKARIYHIILVLVAFETLTQYVSRNIEPLWFLLANILLWFPLFMSYFRLMANKEGQELLLNRELKAFSLGSALLAIGIFALSFLL